MPSKNFHVKQQIKLLCDKGYKLNKIHELINLVNDKNFTYNFVKQVKYRSTQKKNKFDKRQKNKITKAVLLTIRFLTLRSRGMLTARETALKLSEIFRLKISRRTVSHYRKKMGFVMRKPKASPILTQDQIIERLNFAKRNINLNHEDFIFIDETSVWTFSNREYQCRPKDSIPQANCVRKKAKEKLHVWAGISSRGFTDFVIFTSNLNRFGYSYLLKNHLVPFINSRYKNRKVKLIQDNDSKHTSRLCVNLLKDSEVDWEIMPANSPDINVIELFWAALKKFIRSRSTKNLEDIKASIKAFFKALKPGHLQRYIEHFRIVLEEIIKRNGEWTDL